MQQVAFQKFWKAKKHPNSLNFPSTGIIKIDNPPILM